MFDGKAFGEQIVAQVKSYLERATAPLQIRIDELEAAVKALPAPEKGDKGDAGAQGPPVSDAQIAEAVERAVALAVKDIPTAEAIGETIAKAVEALPKAQDGKPGKDAEPTPTAFLISEEGELVSVYADGEKQIIGKVRGSDGKRGASIMDGAVDDSGQLTLRMSDGRAINVGNVRGKAGEPGATGKATNGRDAAELVILPGIDEARSYPAGTCALHRGGTIRAQRETAPVVDGDILSAGWLVMLEGIYEESETDLDNGRQIVRTTVYTSGKKVERSRLTSALIYRGVWKEADWERGDAATWDGSTWHCERPTKDKPGTSEDWRLMTKRGRDAAPVKH